MVAGVKFLHTKNPLGLFIIWEAPFRKRETENSLIIILQLKDTVVAVTNVLMSFSEIPPSRERKNKYCFYHKGTINPKFYFISIMIFFFWEGMRHRPNREGNLASFKKVMFFFIFTVCLLMSEASRDKSAQLKKCFSCKSTYFDRISGKQ